MSEISVKGYDGISAVNNAAVYGLTESIRRAKFPLSVNPKSLNNELTKGIAALAKSEKGSGHDQWLTGVIVQFDLTFSNKAWVEMERYTFVNFTSSQSTMHKISRMNLDVAYCKYVNPDIIRIMKDMVSNYNRLQETLDKSVSPRNEIEKEEADQAKEELKELYLKILYSNPAGLRLTAGLTTNYRQLKTIYSQRKNHRLPEWREFCSWIETLPMSDELIL